MYRLWLCAFYTILIGFSGLAAASEADDSRSFIGGCKALHIRLTTHSSGPDTFYETFSLGYFSGFREAAQLGETKRFCIPREVPISTLVAVYVDWAEKNPSEWKMPVFATVGRALVLNYPCRTT